MRLVVRPAGRAALVTLALLATFVGRAEAQAGFAVVAHRDIGITTLGKEAIADLFLGKSKAWPNGLAAVPVDQPASAPVREAFSQAVLDRSTAQTVSWWRQRLFAGEGVAPPEKAPDAEVLAFVRATKGAVGYVSSASPTDGTVVLLRVGGAAAAPTAAAGTAAAAASSAAGRITPAKATTTAAPDYPEIARRANDSCALTVRVRIDAQGKAEPLRSITQCETFHRDFERAGFAALRKWKFSPARDASGAAVASEQDITIRFQL